MLIPCNETYHGDANFLINLQITAFIQNNVFKSVSEVFEECRKLVIGGESWNYWKSWVNSFMWSYEMLSELNFFTKLNPIAMPQLS